MKKPCVRTAHGTGLGGAEPECAELGAVLWIWLKNGAFRNLGKKSKSQLQPQTEAASCEDQAEDDLISAQAASPRSATATAPPRLGLRTLPGAHALPQHSPH